MWKSKTKNDLIIEVWEQLDCESVGGEEIVAIQTAVEGRFGRSAVDSPMIIARLLADEGAELRHPEIMRIYVDRQRLSIRDAALTNILDLSSLHGAIVTIQNLENLRREFTRNNDSDGLRKLRDVALQGKRDLKKSIEGNRADDMMRAAAIEITQWLSVWLQTPKFFDSWVELRQRSEDFTSRFGRISDE